MRRNYPPAPNFLNLFNHSIVDLASIAKSVACGYAVHEACIAIYDVSGSIE